MLSLVLKETMSGWIELNADRHHEPFEFSIQVFFEDRLHPLRPQPFRGTAHFSERNVTVPVSGELTLKPTGPRYELGFDYPELGYVQLKGEKTYSLFELQESLTTCPLTVYQHGEAIGYAEVAYRDPIMTFPFKSLRLARRDQVLANN